MQGHCETLFQITDHRVLQRWMGKKVDTGVIYHYDELDTEWKDNDLELGNAKAEAAYKFGGKHTPLRICSGESSGARDFGARRS